MNNLLNFFNDGGVIVAWGRSTGLFSGNLSIPAGEKEKDIFRLPFNDISKDMSKKGLYCPGSFVSVNLKKDLELTQGMPGKIGVFYRGNPVFTTSVPTFVDMDRRVIAKFAKDDILLSGYAENIKLVATNDCHYLNRDEAHAHGRLRGGAPRALRGGGLPFRGVHRTSR